MRLSGHTLLIPIATATAIMVSACGGAASATPTTAPKPTQSAAAASPASSAPSAAASPASAAPVSSPSASAPASNTADPPKVNANTASQAEVQQALDAAGVPNAARWAREVDEYRPYPTNDPSFAKLRQELAKYNPSPDVLEKILSTLTL